MTDVTAHVDLSVAVAVARISSASVIQRLVNVDYFLIALRSVKIN